MFPKPGKYKHYKGKEYEVIGLTHHSETLESLVVYKALYESKEFGTNAIWVRPLSMFTEHVEINGEKIPRFKYIGD
ncbi:MAG: DUF1653 domain-containing protein [bacterium]